MTEIASAAAAEATKGIFGQVTETALPYVICMVIMLIIFIVTIYLTSKSSEKVYNKSIEKIQENNESVMKVQAETTKMFLEYMEKTRNENVGAKNGKGTGNKGTKQKQNSKKQ